MKLTIKEKEVVKRLIRELVVSARFFEVFPADEKRGGKQWKDGFTMGAKQIVLSAASIVKDKKFLELVRNLLEMEIEEEKLFGKQKYKKLKKIKAKS